jgi:hypothetical protein
MTVRFGSKGNQRVAFDVWFSASGATAGIGPGWLPVQPFGDTPLERQHFRIAAGLPSFGFGDADTFVEKYLPIVCRPAETRAQQCNQFGLAAFYGFQHRGRWLLFRIKC